MLDLASSLLTLHVVLSTGVGVFPQSACSSNKARCWNVKGTVSQGKHLLHGDDGAQKWKGKSVRCTFINVHEMLSVDLLCVFSCCLSVLDHLDLPMCNLQAHGFHCLHSGHHIKFAC